MPHKANDDDLVMSLVDMALARSLEERKAYIEGACAGDSELFGQVWDYVEWERRMQGFLLDPLYPPPLYEHPFEPGDLLSDRFLIVREVAQGGMGIVYEAIDQKLERRIAPVAEFLKIVRPLVAKFKEFDQYHEKDGGTRGQAE